MTRDDLRALAEKIATDLIGSVPDLVRRNAKDFCYFDGELLTDFIYRHLAAALDTQRVWNCRFHPTDGWHEVGCPHRTWTPAELALAAAQETPQEQPACANCGFTPTLAREQRAWKDEEPDVVHETPTAFSGPHGHACIGGVWRQFNRMYCANCGTANATAHETPAPRPAEAHQETARAIAYEDGPIADSWSDGHSCGSYGCCGGGKEIDRAELQRVIAAALDAAQQAGLSLSIERDPLAVSELLDDSRREREMYHGLVYQIRKLHHEWRDVQLLDLPAAIAAAIATAQQATQPCMRKYVTCDADESPDNWCEACFLRLSPRPEDTTP